MSDEEPTRHENEPDPRDSSMMPQMPPSAHPTHIPSAFPSGAPTSLPTTMTPNFAPTAVPSSRPTETEVRCQIGPVDQPDVGCGHVSSFDCSSTGTTTYAVDLAFDYDIYVNEETDFDTNRAYIEENLLFDMAKTMEVDGCPVKALRRKLQDDAVSIFVGIDAAPIDRVDERFQGECFSTYNGARPASCVPLQGAMEVLLAVPVSEAHRETLLGWIKISMDKNQFIVPGFIEKVVFVGNRTQPAVNPTGNNNFGVPEPDTNDKNKLLIGILAGLGGLFLLLILLILCLRRRRDQMVPKPLEDDYEIDVEEAYHRRSRTPGATGSLAYTDSLALKVQQDLNETFDSEKSYYEPYSGEPEAPDAAAAIEKESSPELLKVEPDFSTPPRTKSKSVTFQEDDPSIVPPLPLVSDAADGSASAKAPAHESYEIEAVLDDEQSTVDTSYNFCSRAVLHSLKDIKNMAFC